MKILKEANLRVIICGGRYFDNYDFLNYCVTDILSQYNFDTLEIVSGNCDGADKLGEKYAKENHYELSIFPADWKKYGKSAGPIRNKQMIDYIDSGDCTPIVIAFKSENSKGTMNTLSLARKREIDTYEISYSLSFKDYILEKSLEEIVDDEDLREGISFNDKNNEFLYDYNIDTDEDFIRLVTSEYCHHSKTGKFNYYYGYRVDKSPKNKVARNRFLKYIKTNDGILDYNVIQLIDNCLENFADKVKDCCFDAVIQTASSSQFVACIIKHYFDWFPKCDVITTEKK